MMIYHNDYCLTHLISNDILLLVVGGWLILMKRIITLTTRDLKASKKNGGCGECQTSCQSACKTYCGIANQKCEKVNK